MTMDISNFGVLPTVQTRKALLLLDFQNDFVRPSGGLHVPNATQFLDILPSLAQAFRRVGDVFWVRTNYESPRPGIDQNLGPLVVLSTPEDDTKTNKRKRLLQKHAHLDDPDNEGSVFDDEAFLSTDEPVCCIPQSTGAQFPAPILAAIDRERDTLLEKSDYTALDDNLISIFRKHLITEVYLCGSLSNISVYATVVNAVRHAIAVNLVEDCLGFRSFGRHREAMRRMADDFGVNGITSDELFEELDWQETDNIAAKGGPQPVPSVNPSGIEGVLDELDVTVDPNPYTSEHNESAGDSRRRRLDAMLAATDDNDTQRLAELIRMGGSDYLPLSGSSASKESSGYKMRSQMSRKKRSGPKSGSRADNRRRGKTGPSQDLRPGDFIGEGDSRIIYELDFPPDAFEKIREEVAWQKMYHMSGQVPRLVAVQGRLLPNGAIPIYRHPADESPPLHPYTSTVDEIRAIVERILGHPLNHVLIQLYRDGQDRISEHSDKTLDIVRGSYICNVSLGAQRVMVLRTKTQMPGEEDSGRLTQRVPLPHESLFILGEKTNMRWLHGIRPDKRPDSNKSIEERAYGGQRISLTFRYIGTFISSDGDTIWGQGAVGKSRDRAGRVIHGDPAETERLIRAFGQENHSTEFDWHSVYGDGFNVVNFVTADTAQLALSGDRVSDMRVRLCLNESGHRYKVRSTDGEPEREETERPLYIGPDGTEVEGDNDILNYLGTRVEGTGGPGADLLQGGAQLQQTEDLLKSWREFQVQGKEGQFGSLEEWEITLSGKHYLGGSAFGIDDCSLWPVLRDIVEKMGTISAKQFPNLSQYYQRVESRMNVKITLEEMQ